MRSLWKPLTILSFGFALLVVYQNCSSGVPFGTTDNFQSLVDSDEFPYEADFDQVAYMSCSEQQNVNQDYQTFFTFRVGAYNSGGVRVTEAFRNEVIRLNDSAVVTALQRNDFSVGTRLNVAIRTVDNLQLMYINEDSSNDGRSGIDYANLLTTFGDQAFTTELWYREDGKKLNYWPAAQYESEYRMEATLHFSESEQTAVDLRNFLSNRGIIALTFVDEGEIYPKGPGNRSGDS